MLSPQDIEGEVRRILEAARAGRPESPPFLTAYQILDRLQPLHRRTVITQRGLPGRGANTQYSAAGLVADAAQRIPGVEVRWLDTEGLSFSADGSTVEAGHVVVGLYRLP